MPDTPVIRGTQDIKGLRAEFNPQAGSHFPIVRGHDGYITAAAGAKVGIMNRWIIRYVGNRDGRHRYRFKAQFSWVNEGFMRAIGDGTLKGRVRLQFKTREKGVEDVDIFGWEEWRYEDGVLILEDIYQETEAAPAK